MQDAECSISLAHLSSVCVCSQYAMFGLFHVSSETLFKLFVSFC